MKTSWPCVLLSPHDPQKYMLSFILFNGRQSLNKFVATDLPLARQHLSLREVNVRDFVAPMTICMARSLTSIISLALMC